MSSSLGINYFADLAFSKFSLNLRAFTLYSDTPRPLNAFDGQEKSISFFMGLNPCQPTYSRFRLFLIYGEMTVILSENWTLCFIGSGVCLLSKKKSRLLWLFAISIIPIRIQTHLVGSI